jgi:hypothetical protein
MKFETLIKEIVSRVIGDLRDPVSIDLTSLSLDTSKHSEERLTEQNIKESEVTELVKRALPVIIQDFVNGEIKNNAEVLITDKSKDLNVVGTLIVKKGDDIFKVITIRKKKDFVPKPGTKHYLI